MQKLRDMNQRGLNHSLISTINVCKTPTKYYVLGSMQVTPSIDNKL